MSHFSKRPTLRHVSHAVRHDAGVERNDLDSLFGGPGSSHALDFTFVGDKKPRKSLLRMLEQGYAYLSGKKRSIF